MSDTDETPTKVLMNGGFDPSELAHRRWAKERERKAAEAAGEREEPGVEDATQNIVVRTTIATGQIMKSLEKAAKKGDVRAAAELRNWMRETVIESETSVSSLDQRTQQELMARLLAEIAADEGLIPEGPLTDAAHEVPVTSL